MNPDLICFRFDGNNFKTEPSSNFTHSYVGVNGIGIYQGKPFVTGSYSPANKKTEIMDYASKKWNTVVDYPFNSGDR